MYGQIDLIPVDNREQIFDALREMEEEDILDLLGVEEFKLLDKLDLSFFFKLMQEQIEKETVLDLNTLIDSLAEELIR